MSVSSADEPRSHRSFRLTRPGSGPAPVALRTAVVLPEREARLLLAAATQQDVARGGRFSAGPAGIQWWDGPWDGLLGSRGSSEHLGSLDWSYDTPNRHYVTIYRVLVTAVGVGAGQEPSTVLTAVFGLTGVAVPDHAMAAPLASATADPFRLGRLRATR